MRSVASSMGNYPTSPGSSSTQKPNPPLIARMPLELFNNTTCFFWSKGLIKRRGLMGVQVVTDQHHLLRFWNMHVDNILEAMGKIHTRASIRYLDVSPSFQRSKDHKQIAHTISLILIIITLGLTCLSRQRLARFFHLLFACFINTDQGTLRIIGTTIDFKNIFHRTDKTSIFFRSNTP